MNNYREQKACINCIFSRVAASAPLYCGINNDFPTMNERYTMEFFEKIRVYEQKHKVAYNGICDNYKEQKL